MENFEQNNNQVKNEDISNTTTGISSSSTPKKNSNGVTVIVSIVIIIILIVAGLFVWGSQFKDRENQDTNATKTTAPADTINQSDDINSIETEVSATVIESGANLDYEFDAE